MSLATECVFAFFFVDPRIRAFRGTYFSICCLEETSKKPCLILLGVCWKCLSLSLPPVYEVGPWAVRQKDSCGFHEGHGAVLRPLSGSISNPSRLHPMRYTLGSAECENVAGLA